MDAREVVDDERLAEVVIHDRGEVRRPADDDEIPEAHWRDGAVDGDRGEAVGAEEQADRGRGEAEEGGEVDAAELGDEGREIEAPEGQADERRGDREGCGAAERARARDGG